MIEPIYMVMFGSYTESIRHFNTADAAYDFIYSIIKKKVLLQHPKVGAGTIQTAAALGKVNVYEIYVGTNIQPGRVDKAVLNKELKKRGLIKDGWSWA